MPFVQGYLGNIEATKASITEDGWFKTGDILTVDSEGYWAVIDRKKEMIKYKVSASSSLQCSIQNE